MNPKPNLLDTIYQGKELDLPMVVDPECYFAEFSRISLKQFTNIRPDARDSIDQEFIDSFQSQGCNMPVTVDCELSDEIDEVTGKNKIYLKGGERRFWGIATNIQKDWYDCDNPVMLDKNGTVWVPVRCLDVDWSDPLIDLETQIQENNYRPMGDIGIISMAGRLIDEVKYRNNPTTGKKERITADMVAQRVGKHRPAIQKLLKIYRNKSLYQQLLFGKLPTKVHILEGMVDLCAEAVKAGKHTEGDIVDAMVNHYETMERSGLKITRKEFLESFKNATNLILTVKETIELPDTSKIQLGDSIDLDIDPNFKGTSTDRTQATNPNSGLGKVGNTAGIGEAVDRYSQVGTLEDLQGSLSRVGDKKDNKARIVRQTVRKVYKALKDRKDVDEILEILDDFVRNEA